MESEGTSASQTLRTRTFINRADSTAKALGSPDWCVRPQRTMSLEVRNGIRKDSKWSSCATFIRNQKQEQGSY